MLVMQKQIDVEIASLGLPRQSEKKVAQRSFVDARADSMPDTPQGKEARRILEERRRAIRRGRIIGGGGAVLLVAVGVLLALQSRGRLAGRGSGLLVAAYFHYQVITSWFRARPRSLLLLRRFTGFSDRSFVVAREIGEACRGLAVALTVQDDSFRGEIPIGLEALLRYIGLPVAFMAPFLLFMVAPHAFFELGEIPVVASAVGLALALYWLFSVFLKRRAVMSAGLANYRPTLKRFFWRVRAGLVMYSGTGSCGSPTTPGAAPSSCAWTR
jgi:hypothetical protein